MNKIIIIILFSFISCKTESNQFMEVDKSAKKQVIYQVFTRLFGNTNTTNKQWGAISENGVGKFNDFTDKALQEILDI